MSTSVVSSADTRETGMHFEYSVMQGVPADVAHCSDKATDWTEKWGFSSRQGQSSLQAGPGHTQPLVESSAEGPFAWGKASEA